jgi:hypothetical protein
MLWWDGHVTWTRKRDVCTVLVGRPLGKHRFKRKDAKPTVYFLKTAHLILCQVAGQMNVVARVKPNACREIHKDKKKVILSLSTPRTYTRRKEV